MELFLAVPIACRAVSFLLYVVFNDLEHFGSLDRTGFERGPRRRQLIVKYTKLFNLGG